MSAFIKILAILTMLFAAAGALLLLVTLGSAKSAPQEAAGAAIAVSLAVIPYCFLRCFDIIAAHSKPKGSDA